MTSGLENHFKNQDQEDGGVNIIYFIDARVLSKKMPTIA